MDLYEAYSHRGNDKLVLIKSGNNLKAGIFAPFWALYNKMWILSAILFCTIIISEYCKDIILMKHYGFIISLFIFLFFYFLGNSILAYKLQNSGYRLEEIILAKSLEEAEYIFLKKTLSSNV